MKYLRVLLLSLIGLTFSCSTEVAPVFDEAEQLEKDLILIDNWLADNNVKDVIIHPTGIRYTINTIGSGAKVELADIVRITYEGRFLTGGDPFDSGQIGPEVFNAGWRYIEGWYHIVLEMSEGDNYTAYFPSKYAYGAQPPRGSSIEPYTVLVFDMNVDKIGN